MFSTFTIRRVRVIKPIVTYRPSQRTKQCNIMTINEAGTEGTVEASIFGCDEYDRTNNISLTSLAPYFKWSAKSVITHPKFIFSSCKFFESELRLVVTTSDYTISQETFALARHCRDQKTNFAALLKTTFLTSGRSSVSFLSSIADASNGKVLATCHSKNTAIDIKTRKKYILPEAAHQLSTPHKVHSNCVNIFEPSTRPDRAFEYDIIIQPSDANCYRNTIHSSYMRFCFDAATAANLKGEIFKNFSEDILFYPVKRARMWYAQRSVVGDLVRVFAWENPADGLSINFQIEKGEQAI